MYLLPAFKIEKARNSQQCQPCQTEMSGNLCVSQGSMVGMDLFIYFISTFVLRSVYSFHSREG